MDSNSDGNRQETQVYKSDESANESMDENVPKILSPELRDVFPIFVNMLDLKSFMKLSMTSKDMKNRCMEDKAIKINVDADKLEAKKENGSLTYQWSCFDRMQSSYYCHAIALHKLPCKINMRVLVIQGILEASDVADIHSYLKCTGVNKIYQLGLGGQFLDWAMVFKIIKDFDVKVVRISNEIHPKILASFLQLNLEKLWHYGPVPDFILDIESPIREITFMWPDRISKEEVMDICSRIQSGSLNRLNVQSSAVDWNEFDLIPFDRWDSLPDVRPLVLARTPPDNHYLRRTNREYWILHWNGGITKCVTGDDQTLRMFKCEPCDYPWILRKEEDIMKDFAEKRPRFSCSAIQFHTFFEDFQMLDPFHEGPLPEHRPLCYKGSKHIYWLLDEKEELTKCVWETGIATWSPFTAYEEDHKSLHLAFVKQIFWNFVEKVKDDDQLELRCEGLEEFDRWFESFEKLDFEFSGPLPSERPLVFLRNSRSRIVLLEDRLVMCEIFNNRVTVQKCKYFYRPPILFTAESVVEMLKDPYRHGTRNFKISFEEFLAGFKMFTRSRSARCECHLIWEQAADNDGRLKEEFWYKIDDLVRKVVWKEGRVFLKEENDLRDAPPNFLNQVFRFFAENQTEAAKTSFTMELEQFNSCLEQFSVVPFDYSGPLIRDSPMAFVKNGIRHTFHKNITCQCSDLFIRVWFLWNGTLVTDCSWGRRNSKEVDFSMSTDDMPPAFG